LGLWDWASSSSALSCILRCADRLIGQTLNLAAMAPSKEVASTAYCLVAPGKEYLVYLPDGGTVIVDLSVAKGELAVEWFDPAKGRTVAAGTARGGGRAKFQARFSAAAVLYLAAGR
jgi:hypothetical protein